MTRRPALHALADRVGILPRFTDAAGVERETSDATREALLGALGHDASTEDAAERALHQLDRRTDRDLLSPVSVVGPRTRTLAMRLPASLHAVRATYRFDVTAEDGRRHGHEGVLAPRRGNGMRTVRLPRLSPGYHSVRLEVDTPEGLRTAEQLRVVSPGACTPTSALLGRRRAFGVIANLYALRSDGNWGIGDLTDLATLGAWAAGEGGAFVGISPLHALRNAEPDVSPYAPVSRLFRNAIYLDVTAVPELAHCPEAEQLLGSADVRQQLARLRAEPRVDYDGVLALKDRVLRLLHRAFRGHASGARANRYAKFVARPGDTLTAYATFRALQEHLDEPDWRRWKAPYRDPASAEVRAFRERESERVDYHRWLQFEMDCQLAVAATRAPQPVGLFGDLALSTAPSGYDAWAFPGLFVQGVSLGSPPDAYATDGQTWSLPPIDPHRLRADRYRYWILLVRHALEHMGALRLDHAMGVLRQFWIPAGRPPTEGAYVQYPTEELLGILALESRRHDALVVGEDLGTVPAGFSALLARWGMLSTRVFYFERTASGRFRTASRYSRRALVTATTHDHPPLAGFWKGTDLTLRREVGSLTSDDALAQARRERERDRQELLARLRGDRLLSRGPKGPSAMEVVAAVHRLLARTPSPLVAAYVDDLAGETEPVNLPGVGPDRYPSWRRKVAKTLETLRRDADARAILRGLAAERRR